MKVSGSEEVLRNPVIASALASARNQVQRYSYGGDPAAPQQLAVRLLFDSAYITGLVIEAGAPIWTASRPRSWCGWWWKTPPAGYSSTRIPLRHWSLPLREGFSRRGVPLQLPLFDLVDSAALSPDQAWNLDDPALAQASARYSLQNVLSGRLSLLGKRQRSGGGASATGRTSSAAPRRWRARRCSCAMARRSRKPHGCPLRCRGYRGCRGRGYTGGDGG